MTFWVAGAVVGASVIGAIGSKSAANTQANAQENAAATQRGMFDTINNQEQPFIRGGYESENRLADLMGVSGSTKNPGYGSFTKPFTAQDYLANQDPGYAFQLKTGAQALRNSDTPGMGSLSGAAMKDLIGFNQGMASTGYQNAFNRYQTQQQNTFARLSGLAGLGQNAASNVGTAGTSLGTGIAQAQAGAGASLASGTLGATGSLAGGANTLAGMMYLNGGSPYSGASTNITNPAELANTGGTAYGA